MPDTRPTDQTRPLIDQFGRHVTYLRLSVTDRCDLRCTYCMAEHMTFLPKRDVLSLEELEAISLAFIRRGVRKIRISGGEPLVRRDILTLFDRLGTHVGGALDELTLTSNATLMPQYAERLFNAGVRRVNISLDTLNAETFRQITRIGDLQKTLLGIESARQAGLKIKINAVAMQHQNADELPDLIAWAHGQGFDITLIEVMPLGLTGEDRVDQYIPLTAIRDRLETRWTLTDEISAARNSGPARYVRVAETGGRIGFITPLTNNFCAGCNRVRVTCTGRIYSCLGQDNHLDLRDAMRQSADPAQALDIALDKALFAKPEKHDFSIGPADADTPISRHMSVTGG